MNRKDTNQPHVTVGIPVFNGSKYIKKAVMSVLNQGYADFELIVTDDGSNDETVSILRSIIDDRIKIVADEQNKGISYRLNQQVDLARGSYFVRMDADDIMFPDRLEKQIAFLESHPQIDAIGTPTVMIDEEDDIIGVRGFNKNPNSIDDIFFSTRFIHPTVAGKTEWFRKWKYDETMSGCEDMDLWIRSFRDSIFSDLEHPVLFWRDSLHFRLKTYIYRQKVIRKCILKNRNLLSSKSNLFKLMLKSYISNILALGTTCLKLDKFIVKRRNKPIPHNEALNYKKILNDYAATFKQ